MRYVHKTNKLKTLKPQMPLFPIIIYIKFMFRRLISKLLKGIYTFSSVVLEDHFQPHLSVKEHTNIQLISSFITCDVF